MTPQSQSVKCVMAATEHTNVQHFTNMGLQNYLQWLIQKPSELLTNSHAIVSRPTLHCDMDEGDPSSCNICTHICMHMHNTLLFITWLTHVEFQGTSRVQKLLHQGLGKHSGSKEDGTPAITVNWSHQAIGDQAEALIYFTFRIHI